MSDSEELELELFAATVTCRTPGCENDGIPLEMMCAGVIECGPCGQQITDIIPEEVEP